jgi:SAM-dependent methyltransferase
MTRADRLLFLRHARAFLAPGSRVLEIGPDASPSTLQHAVADPSVTWETLDLASAPNVEVTYRVADGYEYGMIPDGSYDVVLSANVLEHVPRIWRWMAELARVCRPGGHVITLNPVSWHYHEAPVDCWRVYPEGMRALCGDAGLEVVLSEWGSPELEWLDRLTPPPLRRRYLWQRLSGVFVLWHYLTRLPPEGGFSTITVARRPR